MVLASVFYILHSLQQGVEALTLSPLEFSWLQAAALVGGSFGTLLMSASYHVATVRRLERTKERWLTIALAYSLGQIVRYLPGKVVGVVFQAGYLSGRVRAATVTFALLSQTAYDNLWTLIFAGAILLISFQVSWWPLLVLVAATFLLGKSHQRAWMERLLLLPGPVRKLLNEEQLLLVKANHPTVLPTLTLILIWIPFLAGFAIFLSGTTSLEESVVVGACYLFATVGSMLFFVVPSGIVVREAFFIFIGSQLGIDANLLLVSGVALRLALTVSELGTAALLFALSLVWRPIIPSVPQDQGPAGDGSST